jgi:hypothetical protein
MGCVEVVEWSIVKYLNSLLLAIFCIWLSWRCKWNVDGWLEEGVCFVNCERKQRIDLLLLHCFKYPICIVYFYDELSLSNVLNGVLNMIMCIPIDKEEYSSRVEKSLNVSQFFFSLWSISIKFIWKCCESLTSQHRFYSDFILKITRFLSFCIRNGIELFNFRIRVSRIFHNNYACQWIDF